MLVINSYIITRSEHNKTFSESKEMTSVKSLCGLTDLICDLFCWETFFDLGIKDKILKL